MQNKTRGILLIVLTAVCILILGTSVYAESIINEDGIENIIYSDEYSSQAMAEINLSYPNEPGISLYGQYLSYGTSAIQNLGGGRVNFNGDTTCYRTSEVVVVAVSLQRLVDGYWRTYATRSNTKYDAWTVAAGDTITVTTGYRYRVKGVHTAKQGSIVESVTTYTRDFYIG